MGMMGSVFLLPVFAQTFLGYDATQTGYLFIPMAAAMMLAAPLGGALVGRIQPRFVIFASTLVAGLGLYWFSFLDARSGPLGIILPLGVMAFGMGFGMSQRTSIIASVVPQSEIGVASSVLALARNIAGAFGIAIFSTILTNSVNGNVLNIAKNSILNLKNSATYTQFIGLIIAKAQIDAYGTVFIIASIFVIAGSFLALTIKLKHERTDIKVHVE
jgi:MFS family permease